MKLTATFLLVLIPLVLGYPKVKFQVPDPNGNKIINGSPAELGQFPWLSWLRIGGSWCSSSLIRPNWVLTAAHCINPDTTLYEALLGAVDRGNPGPQSLNVPGVEVIVHPGWNSFFLSNDMALVRLAESVEETEYIKVATLPGVGDPDPEPGTAVTVTGWGKELDDNNGVYPDQLMYSEAPVVITNAECEEVYGSLVITENEICIDSSNGGVCNGDSGGPLNWPQEDGSYIQIGVTSFVSGAGCESGDPHGFTRTSKYLDWIDTVTA